MMSNQTSMISGGNPLPVWLKVIPHTHTHTHTHKVYEGEISHQTISMAITKALYQRLEEKSCRVCVRVCVLCTRWYCTGTKFPMVLTGIVLGWMDGWMDGQVFLALGKPCCLSVHMHVFTYSIRLLLSDLTISVCLTATCLYILLSA